jgi:hypothetical protein
MLVRTNRGVGSLVDDVSAWWNTPSACDLSQGWLFNSVCRQKVFGGPTVAPPPAPTGAALTPPPASGADAQALVDQLTNQQMQSQQQLNAANVQPVGAFSDFYSFLNTVFPQPAAGGGFFSSIPWWGWALAAGGVAVLVTGRRGRG